MADEPLRPLLPFDDEPTPVDARAAEFAANEAIREATVEQLRRRISDLEHENAQLKLALRARLPRPAIEK